MYSYIGRTWFRDCFHHGNNQLTRYRRRKQGGGVMFSVSLVGNKIIGAFKVDDAVKMNEETLSPLIKLY